MATNKKFRIQNGANIQGELSFDNVTVIDSDGLVAAASVQPAVESIVNASYVNALNVTAFEAISAQSVTDISSFTTTDVGEGASLYFTTQRARDAITAGTGVSYDATLGEVSVSLTGGEGITVSGDEISFDGSAIAQDIVPSVDNFYSLGSPDKVWRDVYIGPGSLYINGTKILEDNSGTITMYADQGQNLAFGTTGGGSIDFNAGEATVDVKSDLVILNGKTITTSGGAATVFGGDINLSGNNLCDIGAPLTGSDATNKDYVDGQISGTHQGDKEFAGSVTVQGNLTVEGTTTTVNSQTLSVADNIIDLNSDVVTGSASENAGIRVMRGDDSPAQMRWNEAQDYWEMYDGSSWTKIAVSTDDLSEGSNQYFTNERVGAIVDPIFAGVDSDVAAEAQARVDGDAVLQSAVDAEQAARISGDATVQSAVDAEQTARIAGDSDTLQNAKDYADSHKSSLDVTIGVINGKDSDQDVAISANAQGIADEHAARIAGDSDTLASAQVYADGIQAAGASKDSDQDDAIAANAAAVVTEKGRAEAAEGQLQSAIDNLTSGLSAEQIARIGADSDLQDAIDVVDGKVQAILGTSPETLNTLQEVVAAFQGIDSDLSDVITSNSSRLSTAESKVSTLESDMASRVTEISNIDASLTATINDLGQEIFDRQSGDQALQNQINPLPIAIISGDSDTLEAAKAYADAGDSVVSGSVSTLAARVTVNEGDIASHPGLMDSKDAAVLVSAHAYSEAGDSDTLQNAKDYADNLKSATDISIGNINTKDAEQDGRLDGHDSDIASLSTSLSSRLDSDRLEWIGADSALDARVTTLESEMDTVEGRLDSDRVEWIGKDSDLDARIDTEIARATGVEAGLQSQISNILSNTDQTALNSLSEIVAEFQSVDGTLVGLINSNAADIATIEADVLSLQGINAGVRLNTVEGTLVSHDGRITTLENSMTQAQQDIIDLPGQVKSELSGGLCITYTAGTGVIEIDEAEVRAQLVTHDADNLGGQDPSHYRINVYNVAGTMVN